MAFFVSDEEAEKRKEVCFSCEHLTSEEKCNICQCPVIAMSSSAKIFCPLNKW